MRRVVVVGRRRRRIQTPNISTNCRQGKRAESTALQVWLLMLMLQTLRLWLADLRLNLIRLLPDLMLMLLSIETVSKHLSWLMDILLRELRCPNLIWPSLFAAAHVE